MGRAPRREAIGSPSWLRCRERAAKIADELAKRGFSPSIDVRADGEDIAATIDFTVQDFDLERLQTLTAFLVEYDKDVSAEIMAAELWVKLTPK